MSTLSKYKLKFEDILYETDKATLFLIRGGEVWLPKFSYRHLAIAGWITVREELLVEKDLLQYAKIYHHVPEKLEVIYDQKPIDEIRFDPGERC